jgi:polyhydroxyalkanoate synthase
MTDPSTRGASDPFRIAEEISALAVKSQRVIQAFLDRQAQSGATDSADPLHIGTAFFDLGTRLMADPAKLVDAQVAFWRSQQQLWLDTMRRAAGETVEPLAAPDKGDRRFKDPQWSELLVFDYLKQSYLLSAHWLRSVVADANDGADAEDAKKVDFYTRQFIDALSPSNFALTNPEVLRATVESGGENLLKGLSNLLDDLERGKGRLAISMTDRSAFKVGGNLATTPGKVVFENDLMQLIQYTPTTKTVAERPLLIIPPWINKFYILDMQEKNSFIKWIVDQGQTVFVISWVNPDERLAEKTFEDYMTEGPLAALEVITKALGVEDVNAVGYCIGGTLLASLLAAMAAKKDKRIASATFLTTLVDFTEAGELSVFIDEQQIQALEAKMEKTGYLEGADMATTFNMLRANDLIWSFVVNNYLLGKDPFPFDLLYWNSDSTRMPAAMHSFYLRNMYQRNRLVEKGGITLLGEAIDLTRVTTPTYLLSTREDHIAPWKSTYAATQLYRGPKRFVLSVSGHIAGVINPPAAQKYGYWTNDKTPADPDTWLANAVQHQGSWWPDWMAWLKAFAGKQVPVSAAGRTPGKGKLKAIEDAPGRYVKLAAL